MMEKFLTQLGNALSTAWGWIVLILTAAFTFVEPEKTSFIVVGGAVIADLITGESLLFTRDINKNYWLGVYFDQGFIQYVPVM